MAKSIKQHKYFKEVFGFSESIESVYENIEIKEKEGTNIVILESKKKEKEYQVGTFDLTTINDFPNFPPKDGATFNVIIGKGGQTRNFSKIDVGAMQADPENNGATFQVASNFNCLEFLSSSDSAKRGITKYVNDLTQGPAASISAAPATLYRNYFVPHQPLGEEQPCMGQLDTQINLLENYPLIPVKNGYISFSKKAYKEMNDSDFDYDDVGQIKVGIQKKAQVTSGQKTNEITMCDNDDQIVTQVFTAALDMNSQSIGGPQVDRFLGKVCRFILKAAYTGTLVAAIQNSQDPDIAELPGKNKLFLTCVGGGVFGNKKSWILDELEEQKELIKISGLQIYLVVFHKNEFSSHLHERLALLTQELNGEVIQIK